MAKIEISGISKAYTKDVPVLKDLDLTIQSGEMFFLLGPSGCGKSTLLRILAGLVKPDAGIIRFDGEDVTEVPPEKRRAAMVFQNYALWPHLNLFENVAFGLRCLGVKGGELINKVMEALELVRLQDFAKRRPASLSGGQQQRVALARALAVDPPLLLLDEPLSNLDARLRDAMRVEIRRICRLRKLTALYVTHDRQEALSLADRAAVMDNGVIRQMGTPEMLYDFPADRFCAEFLGDVNLIPGRVEQRNLISALGNFNLSHPCRNGNAVGAIRPERLRILPENAPDVPCSFGATITDRTYLGESCLWRCRTALAEVEVRESAGPARKIGDRIRLSFDPEFLLVFPE